MESKKENERRHWKRSDSQLETESTEERERETASKGSNGKPTEESLNLVIEMAGVHWPQTYKTKTHLSFFLFCFGRVQKTHNKQKEREIRADHSIPFFREEVKRTSKRILKNKIKTKQKKKKEEISDTTHMKPFDDGKQKEKKEKKKIVYLSREVAKEARNKNTGGGGGGGG